ncbi:DndE family protein [Jeotgalibacillus marinus]|uniref:DndE family protein n=1 Tax=Jeotgalibacillus marinus TaxID=86667 RepID=A0ABV3Q5J7_9BACL
MANKKLNLSKDGKEMLDGISADLNLERPLTIQVALGKGLSSPMTISVDTSSTPKWTIPEGIIKNNEYLLFKHLIIEQEQKNLNDQELNKQFIFLIERGLRILNKELRSKNSLQDSRIAILPKKA